MINRRPKSLRHTDTATSVKGTCTQRHRDKVDRGISHAKAQGPANLIAYAHSAGPCCRDVVLLWLLVVVSFLSLVFLLSLSLRLSLWLSRCLCRLGMLATWVLYSPCSFRRAAVAWLNFNACFCRLVPAQDPGGTMGNQGQCRVLANS